MYILAIGLNHRTAPVEVREKMALSGSALSNAFIFLRGHPSVEGCVVLSTCNRTEIYAAARDVKAATEHLYRFFAQKSGLPARQIRQHLYVHSLYDAVYHLFRVASGLDSMILGEAQILAQVRDAYQTAREQGASNGILNTLFQQAITVGKRVRTETQIDHNTVSISYAAVELARNIFGQLDGKNVLVIGAGKMSTLAVKYLVNGGAAGVLVSNRSFTRAQELAREFHGQAVKFDRLSEHLALADIVISCTGASHTVVHAAEVKKAMGDRPDRPVLIIDIAVPRDVDPEVGEIPGVSLYDIDDLANVVSESLEARKRAAEVAETIIADEVDVFLNWLSSLSVVPTIVALKERANSIKEAELAKAFNKLAPLTPRQQKVISSMASSIVNQLLHTPIVNLKDYAGQHQGHFYAEIIQKVFALEVNAQPEQELVSGPAAGEEAGRGGSSAGEKTLPEGRGKNCGAQP
ncbi:MAG: glutamyl-tRNA reductase [Clostridia bacterium]|nr:MAG: glutamyl-tRNA reductase [Clostridia bacterium]